VSCSGKIFATLLATLCALGISADAHGVVLCFGADGHVEIEPAHVGSRYDPCVSAETPDSASGEGCARQDEHHCGMCVDIPLVNPGAASDRPAVPGAGSCQVAPSASVNHAIPTTDEPGGAGPADIAAGPLVFLRATVLLI